MFCSGPPEPGYETVPDRSQRSPRTRLPNVVHERPAAKPRAAPAPKSPETSPKREHRPQLPEVELG